MPVRHIIDFRRLIASNGPQRHLSENPLFHVMSCHLYITIVVVAESWAESFKSSSRCTKTLGLPNLPISKGKRTYASFLSPSSPPLPASRIGTQLSQDPVKMTGQQRKLLGSCVNTAISLCPLAVVVAPRSSDNVLGGQLSGPKVAVAEGW